MIKYSGLNKINNTLHFKYQIKDINIPIQLRIKHKSIATLRSPHVDKRGIDQFEYIRYKLFLSKK